MIFKRVMLTGAAGLLGRELRRSLAPKVDFLRSTDILELTDPANNEELVKADLADVRALPELVRDIDAIVHFGGVSKEADFDTVARVNINGFYHLYEAARKAGVKRVIFSSSVHAIGFYKQTDVIDAKAPYRPDSNYGIAKVFGESVAQLYWDKYNIETVSLRIGSSEPKPSTRRHLLTWISFGDLTRLVERCLSTPRVGHMITYATSKNCRTFWDNKFAAPLGFEPEDSADDYAEQIIAADPSPDMNAVVNKYQGGIFVEYGRE